MAARPGIPCVIRATRSVPHRAAAVLLAGALLPALDGCRNAQADADALRGLVAREVAAINARDLQTLSEIWSRDKDILLFDVPPPGRFQGWDQIGHLWRDFFEKVSDLHLTVEAVQAEARGTLGYATYDWAMTGRIGTYELQDRGQATAIYRKEDGEWRLIHAHYSPVPPALAGLSSAPAPGPSPAPAAAPSPSPTGAPRPGRR